MLNEEREKPTASAESFPGDREARHGRVLLHGIVGLRMPIVLALLVVTVTVLTDGLFARPENLINVARQISFEGLIAFGMTLVIVTGGIDLSVGSLVALTGVVAGVAMHGTLAWPAPACILVGAVAGVGVGAVAGTISGSVVTRFSIPPFIVTLALMLVARGLAFIACAGQPVYELPSELLFLGRGFVWESVAGKILPVPVLVMLVGFVVFHVLLTHTVFGRGVIAVGSNEEAARLAGIAVRRTKLIVYVLTGALCGIVGVLHDVIEDSRYTLDDLLGMGFSQEILVALEHLTKRADEPYDEYVSRTLQNSISRRVKRADLLDNMDIRRMAPVLTNKDLDRLQRYRRAWERLKATSG